METRPTQKRTPTRNGRMTNLGLMIALMAQGKMAGGMSYGGGFFGAQENPIYIPKKHTVQSYRSQQRAAKQRRKAR